MSNGGAFYDEIEVEDMKYDRDLQCFHYPCPCGDRFLISKEDLMNGEEVAECPSCSLTIRVVYEPERIPGKDKFFNPSFNHRLTFHLLMTFFAVERSIGSFYTGGVSAVRNDKIIYSAIEDSLLETDLALGLTTKHLISSGDSIVTFAVSQDASLAVIITKSSLMWIFDLVSKEVVKSWKSHSATPLAVCLNPENEIVAVGFSDRSLRIWNLECGSCLTSIKGFSSLASCLAIPYSDDSKLFCGTSEGKIFCFNYRNGKCLGKAEAHFSVVTSISFSKDPKTHPYFASFSRDKVVCLWMLSLDADSAFKAVKSLMVFESLESGFLVSANANDDQIVVAVGGENGAVSLWNLSQSKLISKESTRQGQSIIQLHEIEGRILSISSEYSIRSLSFPSLSCNFTLQGHKGEITDLSCLGSNLIVATNDEKIKVYQRSNLFHSQELSGHTAIVLCLDSINWKDQDFVLSGAKDHTVRLWRRLPGKEEGFKLLFTCEGHTEAVGAVAFCKSNDQGLTFLSASEDKTIKAWRLLQSSPNDQEEEDDDRQCSVSSLFTIKAHDKDINSLAVASNDQYFASASQDKSAKIWNFKGQLIATLSGHKRGVSCVQFYSSNSAVAAESRHHCQFIATSSADKTIKIWSGSSFECLKTLEGHTSSILKIAFLRGDGANAAASNHSEAVELISISSDGLAKIWNLKNSECIATYDEHNDKIWALCLGKGDNNSNEDGFQSDEMMYTGGADAEIKVWRNITREKQEQEILHQNHIIESNQKLDNLLWKQDYKNAVALAFQLQQPKKLLFILKELIQTHSPSEMLSEALEAIPVQDLSRLIGYCKEWNTSFHNSPVAQMILQALVKKYHWEVLLEQVPEMHKNIEALLPYTQRHIQRLDEMKKRVMLVDYILTL